MFTFIAVSKHLTVSALLPNESERFAWWYGQGLWWSLYGDCQGNGPYADTYLIENVRRSLASGWYGTCNSERLHASGFYLGMIHGGNIDSLMLSGTISGPLVKLTDSDFTYDYDAGRSAPRSYTDMTFMELLHTYALQQRDDLTYNLGCVIGSLSTNLAAMEVIHV